MIQIEVTVPTIQIDAVVEGTSVSVPCLPVEIINSETSEVIAEVESGGQYFVLVFSGILDDGGPYTNSIVDNG